jgi:iron complex outermembrane recepter protein
MCVNLAAKGRFMMRFVRRTMTILLGATALFAGGTPLMAQAAAGSDGAADDEIIVTGVRGSLLRSIEAKRNASTIVDTISAEELGKFPDRNVAEALGNIPGITVGRDGRGEGKSITVRGLGENFAITTLNGRILPTDTADRSFAFDVLPSEMISGAEVRKAVQASALEGSIGGNIDLRLARPLDNKGFHISANVEGSYGDLSKKFGYKASGVVSTTFADATMGLLISATYSKAKIRTDNLGEFSPAQDTELGQQTDFNGNGIIDADGKQYIWPLFYSNGVVLGERTRLGLSGSYQYKPSDSLAITVDGIYSHYTEDEHNYRQSNFLSPRNDINAFDPADPTLGQKWIPGSVKADANGVVTNFALTDLVAEVLTTDEPRKVDTYQVGAHIDWKPSDRLSLVFDGYQGQATRNTGGQNRFVVAGITGASAVYVSRDNGLPDLAITIPGGRTLSQATNDDFRAHYIGIQGDNLKDRTFGLKLDGTYDFADSGLRAIKFGVALTDRRKDESVVDNAFTTSCNYCGYPFTFGQIGASVIRPFPVTGLLRDRPGNFPRNFPVFDIDTYLAALPRADNNPAILDPNTGLPYPAGYSTQIVQFDPVQSFRISEKTWAGYLQADFSGDRWRGDIGVRIVNTRVSSTGASFTIKSIVKLPGNTADYDIQYNDPTPAIGGGKYTKFLPAANFAYDITDQLRLRLAAAKVLSRPTFGELSPAADPTSSASGTFIIFDAGNPNLKPTTATQFDASLEYYLGKRGSFSFAVFYKDIKDFVTTRPITVTITPTDQPAGAPATIDFTRVTVANGDSAKIFGIEAGGQYFFDNGFGISANATYNHSRAKSGNVTTKLPGAIPFSANVKLFYEKHGVDAQISYNYASRYTQAQEGLIAGLPITEDAYHEVSASLGYEITPNVKIYVEGSNLLNQAIKRFYTYRNVPAFYEASGRSFFFGIHAHY